MNADNALLGFNGLFHVEVKAFFASFSKRNLETITFFFTCKNKIKKYIELMHCFFLCKHHIGKIIIEN